MAAAPLHVNHAIRRAPPLTVTRDEIDRLVTVADEALTVAEGEFAGEFAQ